MSKKNKRYKVYQYRGYSSWYRYESTPSWRENSYDRKGLVLFFAKEDSSVWNYITNSLENIPNRVESIPYEERPGVKSWKTIYHTVYMITVVQNGEESLVDLKALKNEVLKRKVELEKPHRRNWHWRASPKCWKDQYKCKKQYLIHKGHKDTLNFDRKAYDLSWEEDDSSQLICCMSGW